MNGVLDRLRGEHTIILDVLDELECLAREPIERETDVRHMQAITRFLHEYVDVWHHGEEERALFPVMRRNPGLADLAEKLTEEHDDGRRLAVAITDMLAQSPHDPRLLSLIETYVQHFREHIEKEDRMIFATVENVLDTTDARQLAREFERIEAELLGPSGVAMRRPIRADTL